MLKTIAKNYKLFFLFLTLVFISPALYGLLHSGFPLTDDGNWMVIRFSAFYEALRAGEFPVRFLMRLNNGYGYPVSNFLYPLFMYLAAPIHILGFNFVNSIKIIFALSLISSTAFAFLWLRKSFDNIASFTGAVLYTLFPYHLFDLYKRGSVGEILSLSILPFVLWQVERKSLFFTSIAVAAIVMAHNTLALFFIPLIFAYCILKNKDAFKFILNSILLGLGLSAFFWLPSIYDSRYTVFGSTQVSSFYNYFINIKTFDVLGLIFFVSLISGFILIFFLRSKASNFFVYSFILSLVFSFLLFSFSKAVWDFIPFKQLIQFPFRLISVLIIIFSFQSAYIVNLVKNKYQLLLAAIFLVAVFISAKPYLNTSNYQYYPDSFYSTNQATTTVKNEYMPKWVKDIPISMPTSKVENLNGNENINLKQVKPNKITFQVFLIKARLIQVNTIYFPGWAAFVNGKKANIIYNNPKGIIQLNLNKGQNHVEVIFGETPVRILADLISIISIISFFGFYLIVRKDKPKSIL